MAEVFARKQLNEDGSPSDRYLINEEFVAMLDYYVAASLSAKVADADAMVTFYLERVALYKAFDGKGDRRDWRPLLLEQLTKWLTSFPECASRKRSRLSSGSSDPCQPEIVVSADDL